MKSVSADIYSEGFISDAWQHHMQIKNLHVAPWRWFAAFFLRDRFAN